MPSPQKSPSKHWISAEKPPLRNPNRPITAPAEKSRPMSDLMDVDYDDPPIDPVKGIRVSCVKLPPQKRSIKSVPNLHSQIPIVFSNGTPTWKNPFQEPIPMRDDSLPSIIDPKKSRSSISRKSIRTRSGRPSKVQQEELEEEKPKSPEIVFQDSVVPSADLFREEITSVPLNDLQPQSRGSKPPLGKLRSDSKQKDSLKRSKESLLSKSDENLKRSSENLRRSGSRELLYTRSKSAAGHRSTDKLNDDIERPRTAFSNSDGVQLNETIASALQSIIMDSYNSVTSYKSPLSSTFSSKPSTAQQKTSSKGNLSKSMTFEPSNDSSQTSSAELKDQTKASSERVMSKSESKPTLSRQESNLSEQPGDLSRRGSKISKVQWGRRPSKPDLDLAKIKEKYTFNRRRSSRVHGEDSDSSSDEDLESGLLSARVGSVDKLDKPKFPEDSIPEEVEPRQDGDTLSPQRLNPLTKMNESKYSLFSSTAGAFRGPGDVYYKFVLGGKNIRTGAKKLKSVALREIDRGIFDEVMVDKITGPFASRNQKSISKVRERRKEQLSISISQKVMALEETRAYIIATVHGIQAFRALLEELKNENEQLKEDFRTISEVTNRKVNDALAENQLCVEQIMKLEKDKVLERRQYVKDLSVFMKQNADQCNKLQKVAQEKQAAYEAKVQDMLDLKDFERASFEDPETSIKRIAQEIDLKNQKIKQLEDNVVNFQSQFNALTLEMDQKVSEKGSEIFENTLAKYDGYFCEAAKSYAKNVRLKLELSKHTNLAEELEKRISDLSQCKVHTKKELEIQWDCRKHILLNKKKDCTPDMDVILPTIVNNSA